MQNRMTVKQCAELMNVSEQFVRVGLQKGVFPWGYAVKMSSVWTYFINPHKFQEIEGVKV